MRPMWQGTISFGLVNIPVNLYNASDDPALGLTLLHKKDASPIRYAKICRAEEKEISSQEIVKGYEYQKHEYVILDDKDFANANINSTHIIDIVKFTNEKEIDIRYFKKPYYLEPDKNSSKPYALLREALTKSNKIAIATCVLHNREHLAIIKAIDSVLVLDFLRFSSEIRDIKGLELPDKKSLTIQEINMAVNLIAQLTGHFEAAEFHDTYKEELESVIKNKISGKKVIKTKSKLPEKTAAKDLMLALKASLKKTKPLTHAKKTKETKSAIKRVSTRHKIA